MSLIGVISSDRALNDAITDAFTHQPGGRWILQFPKGREQIMEFLNFDLPEIVIVNFSDREINLPGILEDVRKDTWLHNFGIIGLFNSERDREEPLLESLKNINVLTLIDYQRVASHIVKLTQIIEENRQIIFQRELSGHLVDHSSGSFTIDNDPLAVSIYAGIAATTVAQRGLIDTELKMHLQLALSELIINGVEHGNCGISFEEKSEFLSRGLSVVELVEDKCKDPEIAAKRVFLEWDILPDQTTFMIRDQGEGFDIRALSKKLKEEGDYALHGRGITMARGIASRLSYNGKGNVVKLSIKHNTLLEQETPQGFGQGEEVDTYTGDIIFREGESSDFLYYIASGEYSVFHKARHVGMLKPGDIFMGEMSFLLNNRRSATVRAEMPGKLIKISRRDFVSVIKQYPHYGIFLSKLLARKLTRANSRNALLQRAGGEGTAALPTAKQTN